MALDNVTCLAFSPNAVVATPSDGIRSARRSMALGAL